MTKLKEDEHVKLTIEIWPSLLPYFTKAASKKTAGNFYAAPFK